MLESNSSTYREFKEMRENPELMEEFVEMMQTAEVCHVELDKYSRDVGFPSRCWLFSFVKTKECKVNAHVIKPRLGEFKPCRWRTTTNHRATLGASGGRSATTEAETPEAVGVALAVATSWRTAATAT